MIPIDNGKQLFALKQHLESGDFERDMILHQLIADTKQEHIDLAYEAALDGASNQKIIYLLGGNDPEKCPFK